MTADASVVTRLHYEIVRGLLESGACPDNAELTRRMNIEIDELEDLLHELSEIRGAVLHPHVYEPWVVHPFSITPTLNWVESARAGWWAPCIWCGGGVAALAGGEIRIHTRLGAELESVVIPMVNGHPAGSEELLVHFAIPPSRAWYNVHQYCSVVLPFRSEAEIDLWCGRHRFPRGEAVPLPQVAALARAWYGTHADPDWHKWTAEEAQAIFHQVGLKGEFWTLREKKGKF